ncbi:hypothetical protein ScPMuIL_013858 [Solemya velum]
MNSLDREIRMLHEFCLKSGYSGEQIELLAKPFYTKAANNPPSSSCPSRTTTILLISCAVLLTITLTASIIYHEPVYKLLLSYGRIASIKVLPLWDWTYFYDECFVDNPFFRSRFLTEQDCEVCDGIHEVKYVKNVSTQEISDGVFKQDFAIIVEDGMRDWPNNGRVDLSYLEELYHQNQALRECMACMFSSNVRLGFPNHHKLLKLALNGQIIQYYAHWQNCLKQASKAFRQVYRRPYFLPQVVELADSNWVFVSSDFRGEKPKEVPIDLPLIMLAQFKGQLKLFMKPNPPCSNLCKEMSGVLKEGQIILLPGEMWSLEYLPDGDENIAVGVGGTFD